MEGRKLKNYDVYLQKLELYAQAAHIKLEWKESEDAGCYVPAANKVTISTNLQDSIEIASILHELGHHADLTLVTGLDTISLANAYVNMYSSEVTPRQRQLVVESELKAWDLAVKIAAMIKIPLGKWFYEFKAECIKSYKTE